MKLDAILIALAETRRNRPSDATRAQLALERAEANPATQVGPYWVDATTWRRVARYFTRLADMGAARRAVMREGMEARRRNDTRNPYPLEADRHREDWETGWQLEDET